MLIDSNEGVAIVIDIGESLSDTWQSGDVMAIWPNGEFTALDGLTNVKILNKDIFTIKQGE